MRWLIGDIHGSYKTMLALIEKVKAEDENAEFTFLGDLEDRGPRSKEVIEYVLNGLREDELDCVKGNHEELMYMHFQSPFGSNWLGGNGGTQTLNSYDGDMALAEKHAEELSNELPLYIIYHNIKDERGRKLLVSHAPCGDFLDEWLALYGGTDEENLVATEAYEEEHGLFARCNVTKKADLINWNRRLPEKFQDKYFNVTGHNITGHLIANYGPDLEGYDKETEVVIDKERGYACIDTGAFINEQYEANFGGKLTALSFPELKVIQQENIEGE